MNARLTPSFVDLIVDFIIINSGIVIEVILNAS